MTVLDPNRGRIPSPDLDDRTWRQIVDQAVALIPRYAPQWTDHGPSDIGITLIELFAWMVEGLTFRLNQVPEKNYIAFLNLLGITRNPPEPARTFLTFSVKGERLMLEPGMQAQTAARENDEPVIFETDEAATILPVNLDTALLVQAGPRGGPEFTNVSADFVQPPAKGATLAVPPGETVRLLLGFDGATAEPIRLSLRLPRPIGIANAPANGRDEPSVKVTWTYSRGASQPMNWPALEKASEIADGTKGLAEDGIVELTVPTDWADQKTDWSSVVAAPNVLPPEKPRFWLALNIAATGGEPVSVGIERLLFNAVSAHSALTIQEPEPLGVGTGKPFQLFQLANGPLFRQPRLDSPYAHLVITVGGAVWEQTEDFAEGPGRVYRVDPVTGEIMFGDHDPETGAGHGLVPPEGAAIVAATYRHVAGGAAANVGGGSVIALRRKVAGITRVLNLAAAYGGADQEPIEAAKRRAPELLRNRNRAVTKEDYEYLAMQASTELASACCLGPRYAGEGSAPTEVFSGEINRSAGNVNVIAVPAQGFDVSPRPTLSPELQHEVLAYLDRRRDVATRLQVHSPIYLPIEVTIAATAWKQAKQDGLISGPAAVEAYIRERVKLYLHPVDGGPEGRGWRVGESVQIAELYRFASPPDKWGFISSLTIKPGAVAHRPTPNPAPAGAARVQLEDFELACFGEVFFTPAVGEI